MCLSSVGTSFLFFGLPIYGRMIGARALEIGGLFSAFGAATLASRPLVGWALDRFGRKPFLASACACYAASMFLVSQGGGLGGLYVAQLIRGAGSSLLWISAYTIATELAAAGGRGRAVGRVDEASNRGQLFGGVVGLAVVTLLGLRLDLAWKAVFVGYGVLAAVGAWVAWQWVPETLPSRTTWQVDSPPCRTTVVGGLSARRLMGLMVVAFITGAASAVTAPILVTFLQDSFHAGFHLVAGVFVPAGLAAALLPSRLGRLSDKVGRVPLIALGLAVSGTAFLLLPVPGLLVWIALLWALQTVGLTMAGPAQEALVSDLTGEQARGKGYGLYSLAAKLGDTIGPLAGGWLYDVAGRGTPFYVNGLVLLAFAGLAPVVLRVEPE